MKTIKPPIHIRLYLWLRSLRQRSILEAFNILRNRMMRDQNFANVWRTNIANAVIESKVGKPTDRQAKKIADQVMLHLFGVERRKTGSAKTTAQPLHVVPDTEE